MARDPYSILGVARGASDADIKSAYRKLAKKYHPDHNRGDGRAQERFAEIGGAYEILGDPDRRKRYDRGEIDSSGNDRFRPGAGGFSPFGDDAAFGQTWRFHSRPGSGGSGGGPGVDDILRDFMNGFGGAARPGGDQDDRTSARGRAWSDSQERGRDIEVAVSLTLEDLVGSEKVRVSLPTGKTVDLKVPEGAISGQQVRLRGQGHPSPTGSLPGDAILTLDILPHPVFQRDGTDLKVDLPVALYDAVLGAKVRAPTLDGPVQISIPAGTSGGKALRLRGKGLRKRAGGRGDLLVSVRIALPDPPDPELVSHMERMRAKRPYTPR